MLFVFLGFRPRPRGRMHLLYLHFFFLNLLLLYYVLLLKVPTVVFPLQAHQLLVPVLTAVLFRQLITFSFLSVGQRQRISKPSVTIATFVRATHHPTFLTQATELTSWGPLLWIMQRPGWAHAAKTTRCGREKWPCVAPHRLYVFTTALIANSAILF